MLQACTYKYDSYFNLLFSRLSQSLTLLYAQVISILSICLVNDCILRSAEALIG